MKRSQSNSAVPTIGAQILYDPSNGGLPDNHVSPLFLANLRRNENVRQHSYWALVAQTSVVTQQLSAVALFVGVFAHLFVGSGSASQTEVALLPVKGVAGSGDAEPRQLASFLVSHPVSLTGLGFALSSLATLVVLANTHKPATALSTSSPSSAPPHNPVIMDPHSDAWSRFYKIAKGGIVLALIALALTPILRTLTKDTSDDTIWALSSSLFLMNLLFCDYSSVSVTRVRYPDSFSVNAAMFASVLLASRLSQNVHVFSLMTLSIETFALFPILRRSLRAAWKPNDVIVALVLICLSLVTIYLVSASAAYVYACVLVFVQFVCPLWFLGVQKYKDEIRGPWDEAKPVIRGM
ncbi:phosphatidylinositol N-acetylglucosaminyltransferase subunit C [Chytriomyces sp. MP71]|nr:phosphatidylinositol N-acetylglucosaminyltransferase subunit C [Chytriomyces sp. MP71]